VIESELVHSVDVVTEKTIRMLEQLNRTLELLQNDSPIDAAIPDRPTPRQVTEEAVLACIQILCTPMVQVKRQSA
jgi:hypothetical protein